jgi:hypothetical protein
MAKLKGTKSLDQIGCNNGHPRQKYVLSDADRELLREIYDGRTETITYLSERLKVPRDTIKAWASHCGLTRQYDWTAKEIEYLERFYHILSLKELTVTLNKSRYSIHLKACQMGLRRFDEGYTAASLAEALGVARSTICEWVKRGWLPNKRRKTHEPSVPQGEGWEAFYFTNRDVRNFIIKHPERVTPTSENWLWLVDILAGGKHGIGEACDEIDGKGKKGGKAS